MTFKTFEQLDREAGAGSLFTDYARKPLAPDTAGYDTPETLTKAAEIAQRSTFAAAFRQDNTVASIMSRKDMGVDNHDDGAFDPVAYVRENNLNGHERNFMGVMNGRRADAIKAQIEQEARDRETLNAAGMVGTLAQIAAGVLDVPTLIPGTVAVRGAAGGFSVGKSALMAGVSAGATQAVTEGVLHTAQQTRELGESALNVGAAVVMGSLLGAGAAAILGKNERIAAQKALEELTDLSSGVKPNVGVPAAAGAEVADGAFYVDPIQKVRTREELAVEGKAAGAVASATSWFNPVLRGTQRYAASARQIVGNVYESTIYRAMHSAGETTGASVEAAVRTRVYALQAQAGEAAEAAYDGMRATGVRMNKDDFYAEVGRTMRNGDENPNSFVAQAAQGYRKLFDQFTDDALKLGKKLQDDGVTDHPFVDLLREGALDVKTAASYFSRMYNRDRLLASEPEFLDVIGGHMAQRMAAAHVEDGAKVTAARARFKIRSEDANLSGAARSDRIAQIEAAGTALDTKNAHLNDLIDDLTVARSAVVGSTGDARKQAQANVKSILQRGGSDLQDYLKQRADLRARMRNLTERNPDAQAARAEKLDERIAGIEEQVSRSLSAYAKRAKNLLNKSASDPAGRAETSLAAVELRVTEVQRVVDSARDRANKLAAQYVDEMNPQASFAREADRAAAGGMDTNAALRAGTREADRVEKQINDGRRAVAQYERYSRKLDALQERLAARETGVDAAREMEAELEAILKEVTDATAQRSVKRGEFTQRLKERAAKLTPEEIAKRAAEQNARFTAILEREETRFDAKWGPRRALGLERGEAYDFEAAGKAAAKEVYDKLTGKVQQREDLPSFVTKVTTGPMKDRTFMVPDQLLAGRGWLNDDVREVANRYSRSMAGEIELTRRFGRGDMRDQLEAVSKEYSDMRIAAGKATSTQELNSIIGRDKFSARKDLEAAKLEVQQMLASDETSAVTDIKAGRDLIRGTYSQGANNSNFASVTRSLMHFNYLRSMGGVLLSNLSDFYRPAFVHGLKPYLQHMPDLLAQAFGKGSEGLKLSITEAKLSGLVTERVTHALMAANGDIVDPFMSHMSHVERFMQKGTAVASRWNFINVFTDAQQAIASTLSQHRILETIIGNAGKDGSFVGKAAEGERLLRMLGIDADAQSDIAKFFAAHGQTVDGIRVANTEKWLQAANASGVPKDIERADRAVRAYRTAMNTDVNSIVSRRGLGDAPLFANTPLGRMLVQFSGYNMGAHSRVMMRGMQEGQTRMIGGLAAMTSLGMLTATLSAWRGGKERFDKFSDEVAKNPSILLAEGLDRSGFFPMLMDFSNRVERVTGGVGYEYRFNPVKSTIAKLGGGNATGYASTRASDSSAVFGAILGPSAGLVDSGLAVGRVAADAAAGRTSPKRDVNQALASIPYQSYFGARELLQVMTGNSPYTRN